MTEYAQTRGDQVHGTSYLSERTACIGGKTDTSPVRLNEECMCGCYVSWWMNVA